MTIIGISPVPPVSRTADTHQFPTAARPINQPADQISDPAVRLGRHAYNLMHAGIARTLPELADALHVSEDQVTAGIVAFLREETGYDLSIHGAPLPCPPWCSDCWKGSNRGEDPDPGITFHHSTEQTITTTNGPETGQLTVSVERIDDHDTEGRTQVHVGGQEASVSMTPDQAHELGTALVEAAKLAGGQR